MKKISIIIPFYNEEGNILRLTRDLIKVILEIKNYKFDIFLIDDCSIDQGKNLLKKFLQEQNLIDVNLIENDKNIGKSYSLKKREGNEKMIIGRISKENHLAKVIKDFLDKNVPLKFDENDSRFMDSFDHVLTALVNQAEKDKNFNVPFNLGPIKSRRENIKMRVGNNWYSDVT